MDPSLKRRRRNMRRLIAGFAAFLATSTALGADGLDRFVGEWKTTMGPATLERKGDELAGKIVFYKLPLKGKLEGKNLSLGYDEGPTHVDGTWELDPSGNAFRGSFRASNGNRGVWNGW